MRGIYTPSPKTAPWDKTKGYSDVYTAAPGYVNSWRQINSRRDWLAGGWLWTGMDCESAARCEALLVAVRSIGAGCCFRFVADRLALLSCGA